MNRLLRSLVRRKMSTISNNNALNALGKPLIVHSLNPVTGFFRNGFCDTDPSDTGNHTIAGVVTDELLDFSASRGNDLRSVGLKDGCRWCLCANRWKEAFDNYKSGKIPKKAVPKVDLQATHIRALQSGITLRQLEEFALRNDDNRFLPDGKL